MAVNYLFEKSENEDDTNAIGVGHFYFHYTQKGRQTPSHVAARILKQIVNQIFTPSATLEKPENLERLYENSKKDCPPQLSQLRGLCIEYSKRFSKMYVLFDALDECETDQLRDEIIYLLTEFAKSGLKVLLMSQGQYLDRVRDNFRDTGSINFKSMPVVGQDEDWKKYIVERLEKERTVRDLEPFIDNLIKDPNGSYSLPWRS
jgi:hypothetical protein